MSIEYQLYSMSSINHIIIPIVGSRQNLQEQNVFKHTYLNITPQKGHHLAQPILWKKSMSAFKKFKQKKIKKDKKNITSNQELEISSPQHTKGRLKLTIKTRPNKTPTDIYSEIQLISCQSSVSLYYDPNEAPLYQYNIHDPPSTSYLKQYQIPSNYQSAPPIMPQLRLLKGQSEMIEEQNPVFFTVQPRADDPFIIVRRGGLKKTSKSIKSKHIKKQRMEKIRSKDGQEGDEQIENSKIKLQTHQSPLKNSFQGKSSDQQSSQEELGKTNRQIFTLSQIIKSAAEQKLEQTRKSHKTKESICRELSFCQKSVQQ